MKFKVEYEVDINVNDKMTEVKIKGLPFQTLDEYLKSCVERAVPSRHRTTLWSYETSNLKVTKL